MQKNVLVPLGPHSKNLGTVQHALALAKRIPARVFILKFVPSEAGEARKAGEEDIMGDLVATALQAGLNVSYHTASGPYEEEIIGFVHREAIDILVLGPEGAHLNRLLLRSGATTQAQVILVKQKEEET